VGPSKTSEEKGLTKKQKRGNDAPEKKGFREALLRKRRKTLGIQKKTFWTSTTKT